MIINWNIKETVRLLLPYTQRDTKVLLGYLQALVAPIEELYSEFLAFRTELRMDMTPNGQTMSLEWHLNAVYDTVLQRIFIVSASEILEPFYIYNSFESADPVFIYFDSESAQPIYLYNEAEFMTGNYFVVNVPTSVYDQTMHARIKKYKLAGTKYIIKLT